MFAFDYIIVGGGSAGCVLASRLSENPDTTVALLEAGPEDKSPLISTPLGIIGLMNLPRFNWKFESQPEPYLNNRPQYCPRGKGLGGSSSINAMIYIRGHADDYANWTEEGNSEWTYADLLPYFKKAMHQERGECDWHGTDGPLNVTDAPYRHPVSESFLLATLEAGHKYNPDFNGASQEGMGWYQLTMKDGERCSAARAYLHPVRDRKNLTVITEAQTTRVLFKGRQATGVEVVVDGKMKTLQANREVLLCAGSLQSPQLLMLSGVGDAAELQKHSIPVHHILPGVGKNLQEHSDVVITQRRKKWDTLSFSPVQGVRMLGDFWHYYRNRTGLLAIPPVEVGGFFKSSPEVDRPDIQIQFIPMLTDDHGRNLKIMTGWGYSTHINLLRPKSRGHLALASSDPFDAPEIHLNMMSDPDDMDILVKGLKKLREIYAAKPLQKYAGEEVFPGSSVQSDTEIAEFIRQKAAHVYHPVGTCKMGRGYGSVVDYQLRVHGLERLRVVDASIMPTLVSGNTNAPVIAIAEKAADMIQKSWIQPELALDSEALNQSQIMTEPEGV
ncbi:choline dehydrogenase [Sansalvadorimonas sp. 2012CJ34-2]|uniref:Choline dehydrogenase n=1 Tax=Parendozoicomonas callyspongiae TaxID=2942213 RepID=A0ABT0PG89_9GAMM|nr:choline dehydrogenase [Sansalvadorimonas sp. 2012CJ34-2]MCL6270384.1 choline dehydrogenase [Sansalvadorimonas sp. 2012CJ34-2]